MRCERASERCGMNRCTKRYYIRIKYDVLLSYKKRANSIRKLKPVFASIVHQVCDMVAVRERTKAKNLMCAQLKIWNNFFLWSLPHFSFSFFCSLPLSLSHSWLSCKNQSESLILVLYTHFSWATIFCQCLVPFCQSLFHHRLMVKCGMKEKRIPNSLEQNMSNEAIFLLCVLSISHS